MKNKNSKIQKSKNQKSKFQKSKNQKSKFQKSKIQKSKNTKKFPYMEILNKEIHVTQISLNGDRLKRGQLRNPINTTWIKFFIN